MFFLFIFALMRNWFLVFVLLLQIYLLGAAECSWSISAQVIDKHDNSTLEFAEIEILETSEKITSDEWGKFKIENLCAQTYTFVITHWGCEPDTVPLNITNNIEHTFYLEHHIEELAGITATASRVKEGTTAYMQLKSYDLQQLTGKDLAQALQNMSGVRTMKTGANINKPVVNGFYGDRVTLVNNGIMLHSQDWGTEHAPEIDVNSINQIEILQATQTVEYTTQNIGATIAMEAPLMPLHKHTQFGVLYGLQTNGLQNSLAAFLQKGFDKKYAFRIQAAFKKGADLHTPQYTMSNTAQQEADLSFQQKFSLKKINVQTLYSMFSQNLGILRAAHVGNIGDLERAINSDKPLIINDPTFKIQNPKQKIAHHLADIKMLEPLRNNHFLEYRANVQSNRRKEFDIRRGGRSDIPALDMHLLSVSAKAVHHNEKYLKTNWKWNQKNGAEYQYKNNTNNPQTGIMPIIPDYIQSGLALFSIHEFYRKNLALDFAARYEFNYLSAYFFEKNKLVNNKYLFNTYNFTTNISWIKTYFDWQSNISFSSKMPNISELHSNGLHHGTAAIEYGNPDLSVEKAFGWTSTLNLKYQNYISINTKYKIQYIKDFIFIQPSSEFLLTIRGAFPIFQYQAANALFHIIDINAKIQPIDFFEILLKANIIRAKNMINKDYIINIPADAFSAGLKFSGNIKKLSDAYVSLNGVYTLKQKRTPALIPDYKPAPDACFLLNFQTGATARIGEKNRLTFSLALENILNTVYRDYLNRFRYFTDETGFNATFRINYFFN
jgi:iron complex outermembrane receptor protein